MATAPPQGPKRWAHYGRHVVKEGIPLVWAAVSFVTGVGIVSAIVALADLSAAWIVAAAFAVLFVLASVGGYRLWSGVIGERDEAQARAAELEAQPRGGIQIANNSIVGAQTGIQVIQGSEVQTDAPLPSHVVGRLIRVADHGPMVLRHVFEKCEIRGPAPVMFAGGEISGLEWLLPDDDSFIVLANPDDRSTWPPGTVVFRECIVRDCVLKDFRVVGDQALIGLIRDDFGELQ